MRVTNSMMTNNALINMSKNKEQYNNYLEQYTTQKKIQRPSDDPTIAVRSLKFRTNLVEIEQYVKKNIPDATSWMGATEEAMKQVNSIYTQMLDYCTSAANDTNTAEERASVASTLKQYKGFIYEQQGNADYAGRYLFTGYRTDVPLLFKDDSTTLSYKIKEEMKPTDLENFNYVEGDVQYAASTTVSGYASQAVKYQQGYRLTLSYKDIDSLDSISYKKGTSSDTLSVATVTSDEITCNDVAAYNTKYGTTVDCLFIKDTGAVVLSSESYEKVKNSDTITADYTKAKFEKGDVRPEHYFDCTMTDTATGEVKTYENPSSQNIQYEVNFSQKLTVNTLACNAIDLNAGRTVDKILNALYDVDEAEEKLSNIEQMIKANNYTGTSEAMEELRKQAEQEVALKNSVLQQTFSSALTSFQEAQKTLNVAVADHGSRAKRLELTSNKLAEQKVDFEEALSENEDADLGDAYIKYNEADLLYQATLSATSKVIGKSLLDFI